MDRFTLSNPPADLLGYRKSSMTYMCFIAAPFEVDSQEGVMLIAPTTVDDWENGYYVAYPADGSKPYAIAPAYVRANYVPV